jgi:hypothetical protein
MIGQIISRYRFEKLGRVLTVFWLLCYPASAENDLALAVGRPAVGNTSGSAISGNDTWYEQQSAKPGPSVGVEFRHWFTDRSGMQLDCNRTSTNASFIDSYGSLRFAVGRYEMNGTLVRYFGRSESRLHPFLNAGPGVLLFNGGSAPGGTVGWSAALEGVVGGGFDTPVGKHIFFRTGYRLHLFRNTNYGDPGFHPGFAHIEEPIVGLGWKF